MSCACVSGYSANCSESSQHTRYVDDAVNGDAERHRRKQVQASTRVLKQTFHTRYINALISRQIDSLSSVHRTFSTPSSTQIYISSPQYPISKRKNVRSRPEQEPRKRPGDVQGRCSQDPVCQCMSPSDSLR
ncbi:hypothetical protein BDV95DRAFT_559592 [Massariosphaeria phaeospora]|uniref:Uncharacterized protein n=1 Tax=Massariosphaeria phaeospora TaxID=100035 RepID=A0A7C8MD98_9PLEO|nr:hypothetical protein BDV95DRAFT_559592 [Massariosphaeria phaeospora]